MRTLKLTKDSQKNILELSLIHIYREQLEELLSELRTKTPEEVKRYQKIISNKEAILADAQAKADQIIAQAQIQTNELVSEHQICLLYTSDIDSYFVTVKSLY